MGLHLRVEATLLGHVPKSESLAMAYRLVVPFGRAGVGSNQPKKGPHRRGLAGAVGSEESEHSTPGNVEPTAIERDDAAKAFVKVTDREHGTGEATSIMRVQKRVPRPRNGIRKERSDRCWLGYKPSINIYANGTFVATHTMSAGELNAFGSNTRFGMESDFDRRSRWAWFQVEGLVP